MDPLFLALLPVGGIVVTIVTVVTYARLQASRVLRDASRLLGLEIARPRLGFTRRASGTIEGSFVTITPIALRESEAAEDASSWSVRGGPGFRVVVTRAGRIPESLSIRSSSRGLTDLLRPVEHTLTGDTTFDAMLSVRGPLPIVLALLDYATRLSLTTLVTEARGSVEKGCVRLDSGPHEDGPSLADATRFVIAIAAALSRSGSLAGHLAANARSDSIHRVRQRNLEVLFRTFPDSEEATSAARQALSDSSPHVQLAGAAFLGVEARETLRRLATEKPLPEEITAGALAALVSCAPADDVAALLLHAARHERGSVRVAAIEGLGSLRHAPAVGTLAVLLDEANALTAGAAARALGAIPGTQIVLLSALRSSHTEALAAIIDVLGKTASVEAVPPLLDLARDGEPHIRQAAREAVRQIQARAPGAGTGQLAIAEAPDPQGALALVEDANPRGRVALVDETER